MPATIPKMIAARQVFPLSPPLDIPGVLRQQFEVTGVLSPMKPGARIAVAVGSRGITNLPAIVRTVVAALKSARADPFIIPAMGSHGGATPEGQAGILEEYGVSEREMGVPVRASMEVERIGASEDGVDVFCSVEGLHSDGIVIINRIKPHTDFQGTLGSGVMKMMVIGLGKRAGAAACHAAASRLGYERTLRGIARVTLRAAPILCGVAIVEDQFHETARLEVLKAEEIEERELELLEDARRLMPRLPLDDIDLLIVDRIGKNISGAGMDPNVTGRWVHGYSTSLGPDNLAKPMIRRIFVRGLTPESHGNAIGIGFADITTTRLVQQIDKRSMFINALTSLTPNGAKIPIHFDTDREAIEQALVSLALSDNETARVVRIGDTLSLAQLEVSATCANELRKRDGIQLLETPRAMAFDAGGDLTPLRTG